MATDFERAMRADMERLNKAAEPVHQALCRAYIAANVALLEEWARMLRAQAEGPGLEALNARLDRAEKTRLEKAAWADYQWRKAHPWRTRMRAFGRYADRVRQDIHHGVIDGFDRIWYS